MSSNRSCSSCASTLRNPRPILFPQVWKWMTPAYTNPENQKNVTSCSSTVPRISHTCFAESQAALRVRRSCPSSFCWNYDPRMWDFFFKKKKLIKIWWLKNVQWWTFSYPLLHWTFSDWRIAQSVANWFSKIFCFCSVRTPLKSRAKNQFLEIHKSLLLSFHPFSISAFRKAHLSPQLQPSFVLHLWHCRGCQHSHDGSVQVSMRYFWNDFWNNFLEGLLTLGVLTFEVLFPPLFLGDCDAKKGWASGLTLIFRLCHACSFLNPHESSLEQLSLTSPWKQIPLRAFFACASPFASLFCKCSCRGSMISDLKISIRYLVYLQSLHIWYLDEYPLARCPDRTETILFGAPRSSVFSFLKYFPADDLETFLLPTGDLHPISYQNIIQTIWRPRKIRYLRWDFCSSKEIFFFLKFQPCIIVLDAVSILASRVSILK